MDPEFGTLLAAVREVLHLRQLSNNSWAGSVGAVLLTADGNIYTGVCIDTPCSMGFCAEHAAVAAMVTAGENRVLRLVALQEPGEVVPPCGRCREFLCQLHDGNGQCRVLLPGGRVKTLDDLLPDRWA